MTICYCGIDCTDNDDGIHSKCNDEYTHKDKDGICVRCGMGDARPGLTWCFNCNSFSLFLGYLGGVL